MNGLFSLKSFNSDKSEIINIFCFFRGVLKTDQNDLLDNLAKAFISIQDEVPMKPCLGGEQFQEQSPESSQNKIRRNLSAFNRSSQFLIEPQFFKTPIMKRFNKVHHKAIIKTMNAYIRGKGEDEEYYVANYCFLSSSLEYLVYDRNSSDFLIVKTSFIHIVDRLQKESYINLPISTYKIND
ncbi:hypothetical protein ABPG74_006369 [Tetrahymena malaccensis]